MRYDNARKGARAERKMITKKKINDNNEKDICSDWSNWFSRSGQRTECKRVTVYITTRSGNGLRDCQLGFNVTLCPEQPDG